MHMSSNFTNSVYCNGAHENSCSCNEKMRICEAIHNCYRCKDVRLVSVHLCKYLSKPLCRHAPLRKEVLFQKYIQRVIFPRN